MFAHTSVGAMVSLVFGLVAMVVVAGIVFSLVTAGRKASVLRRAGLDPLTADARLLARARASAPEPDGRPAEARLAEAQDLHRKGLITADELGEIRQRILSEV